MRYRRLCGAVLLSILCAPHGWSQPEEPALSS